MWIGFDREPYRMHPPWTLRHMLQHQSWIVEIRWFYFGCGPETAIFDENFLVLLSNQTAALVIYIKLPWKMRPPFSSFCEIPVRPPQETSSGDRRFSGILSPLIAFISSGSHLCLATETTVEVRNNIDSSSGLPFLPQTIKLSVNQVTRIYPKQHIGQISTVKGRAYQLQNNNLRKIVKFTHYEMDSGMLGGRFTCYAAVSIFRHWKEFLSNQFYWSEFRCSIEQSNGSIFEQHCYALTPSSSILSKRSRRLRSWMCWLAARNCFR
jgi:hypothetical protein